MGEFGIGQSVLRREDSRLLTGQGHFVDDETPAGTVHAVFLRAPHAHARIGRLDISAAKKMPGVLGVFTGADIAAAGLGTIPCVFMPDCVDGKKGYAPPHPLLAQDVVRYVGEAVALVVAASVEAGEDAAEKISIDYEPLDALVDPAAAIRPDAPRLWPEAPENISMDWETGDAAATAAGFSKAAHTVSLDLINNRIIVAATETRGALAYTDPETGRLTLVTASQLPHPIRDDLVTILGGGADDYRVVVRDVGGGFGIKNSMYPEQALVAWAARELARPVKWIGQRSDAFLTDYHGRDNRTRIEIALDDECMFLALRADTLVNFGAYLAGRGAMSAVNNVPALIGAYLTPAAHVRVRGVFTNTVPTDVYRGAGRPEAIYAIERLVDLAAAETGIDRIDLRRRNMIPPARLPYKTPLGLTYDSGDYAALLDRGLSAADWEGFPARRAEALNRGRLRGIGFANYVERCGAGVSESAELRVHADGGLEILIGTMSNGQGHETVYAQVAAELLGIAYDRISVVQGDTDRVKTGRGTGGSRSIPLGGAAIRLASDTLIEKAKQIAAHVMEAAVEDIEFDDGTFAIAGTDRRIGWVEVARTAHEAGALPPEIDPGLDETAEFTPPNHTFPNGCHVCEVEIDPETGALDIVSYSVAHDFGRVLNPTLLEGQVHGGVAQGLGQAAMENTVYDAESGQLLSASFMDYTIPHAADLPNIQFVSVPSPCPSNPMDFKGCGESGAAGAPPAMVNAAIDALSDFGIRHLDMPLTAERVWRAMRDSRGAA